MNEKYQSSEFNPLNRFTELKEESSESTDIKSDIITHSDKLKCEVIVNCWHITKLLLTICSTLLTYCLNLLLEGHFIGDLGDLDLNKAFNVYLIIKSIFYSAFLYGMLEGLIVISSKSFGDRDFTKMGYELHYVVIISYSSLIIGHVLYSIFSKQILIFIAGGQLKYLDQLDLATQILFVSIYIDLMYVILERLFQSQSELLILNIVTTITFILYPILLFVIVGKLKLGLLGCSLAFGIFSYVQLTIAIIYLKFYHNYPKSIFFLERNLSIWQKF